MKLIAGIIVGIILVAAFGRLYCTEKRLEKFLKKRR